LKIRFRWNAILDERTCPVCEALHGHEWEFEVTSAPLPQELTFNGQTVWNMGQGSRAHGHTRANCRCTLEFNPDTDIDMSDVFEMVQNKITELEAATQ